MNTNNFDSPVSKTVFSQDFKSASSPKNLGFRILNNETFKSDSMDLTLKKEENCVNISNRGKDFGAVEIIGKKYTEGIERFTVQLTLSFGRIEDRAALVYSTKSEEDRETCGFFEIRGLYPDSSINNAVINEGRKSNNFLDLKLEKDKKYDFVLDVNRKFGMTKFYIDGEYKNGTIDVPEFDSPVYLALCNADAKIFSIKITKGSYEDYLATENLALMSKSLDFDAETYMSVSVNAENIPVDCVELLLWDKPQKSYVKGTQSLILEAEKADAASGNIDFTCEKSEFESDGKIYFRACANLCGRKVYSPINTFSSLEYAYGKDKDVFEIAVRNGSFADSLNITYEKAGSALEITADKIKGKKFSHFENIAHENVGNSYPLTVRVEKDEFYTAVYSDATYSDTEIRTATYNTAAQMQAEKGYGAIAKDIIDSGAEIISLQEVAKTIKDVDTMSFLGEKTGYHYAFVHTANNCVVGAYGNGLLSKYPIVSYEIIPLPTSPKTSHRRYTLHAKLDVNGYILDYFAIHCEQRTFKKEFEVLEYECAKCDSFVIAGDYNNQNFGDFAILPNSHIVNNEKTPYHTTVDDYMFDNFILSNNISYKDTEVIKTGNSDHYMLVTTIILKTEN